MSDMLLELSQNPTARKLIQGVGLPIPMPPPLARMRGASIEQPLADRDVLVGGAGSLTAPLAASLAAAGARIHLCDEALEAGFAAPCEAFGRPASALSLAEPPTGLRPRAMVMDATGLGTPAQLVALYGFFKPMVRMLDRCARVVVLGRPVSEAESAECAAAQAGLEGFVRSLAKEIGSNGSTANLVRVSEGAEPRLDGVLRFLLSEASAFVTGQPMLIDSSVGAPGKNGNHTRTLTGKVALVTGAARGIGAATAALLAEEGAHVVVLDRPADDGPASQVARDIGGSVLLADVSTPGAPDEIVEALVEAHGGVDIVVHNAGVTRDKMLRNMKPELWNQAVDINLDAVARITAALLAKRGRKKPALRDGGRIVCLSSIAGIAGNNGQTNYAASKAGIVGYVQRLAQDTAGRNIGVNAVAPGFIETRLTAAIPVAIREVARRLSALSQGGQPEDVARAITFLSSPGSVGMSGQVLRVCGGAFVGA